MKKEGDIIFLLSPVPKPRMTRADTWKKRPIVLSYWAFKDAINLIANKEGFKLGNAFRIVFYIEMPKSWSKKKKEFMNGKPHKQKPDLDNLLKAVSDCLLNEDSGIYYVIASKKWSYTGKIKVENFPEKDLDF